MQLNHHIRTSIRPLVILLFFGLIELATAADVVRLNIHRIGNWYAPSDNQLIIEDHTKQRYRVDFFHPCHGLVAAETLAFISRGGRLLDRFSAVVLPDGSRCSFAALSQRPQVTTPHQ